MKKYTSLLLICTALFFASCETDFSTIADYQDITVVYGLLDSKDTNLFVKINKAYLSEGDVLTYAANPDSNLYLYKLDVKIEERSEAGNLLNTFVLDTTTIYDKEPGIFYTEENVIYTWTRPQYPYEVKYIVEGLNDTIGVEYFWLNDESIYNIIISNPETEKEITSETPLVQDFRITKPGFGQTIRFVTEPINPKEFQWEVADNGSKFEFELRFNYGEWMWDSPDTVYKYIVLASATLNEQAGSSTLSYYYWDDNFYTTCANLIPYDSEKEGQVRERYTSLIDIVVKVAEDNLAIYMEVNEPSSSIIQEKPQYSNIENGIGLFSSRLFKVKTKKLHAESVNDLKDLDPDLKFKF